MLYSHKKQKSATEKRQGRAMGKKEQSQWHNWEEMVLINGITCTGMFKSRP